MLCNCYTFQHYNPSTTTTTISWYLFYYIFSEMKKQCIIHLSSFLMRHNFYHLQLIHFKDHPAKYDHVYLEQMVVTYEWTCNCTMFYIHSFESRRLTVQQRTKPNSQLYYFYHPQKGSFKLRQVDCTNFYHSLFIFHSN